MWQAFLKKLDSWEWKWKLLLIFGLIILASIIAIILILVIRDPKESLKDTITFEIVKLLLQIITVLVLGQVISIVIGEFNYSRKIADEEANRIRQKADEEFKYERQKADEEFNRERQKIDNDFNYNRQKQDEEFKYNRQKADVRIEIQKNILSRLVRNYTAIKKHRRLLRAKALSPAYIGQIQENTTVRFDVYDEQMQFINEIELEFENILEEIKSNSDSFSNSKCLIGYVKKMKNYLRDLIKLYEQKLGDFDKETGTLLLSNLKIQDPDESEKIIELMNFVGKAKKSMFESDFVDEYDKASEAIREDIKKTLNERVNSSTNHSDLGK
jgi:hypothetical protein